MPDWSLTHALAWACLALSCVASPLRADPSASDPESLRRLVRQLDAEDFEARRLAKEQLVAAGSAAVPVVREAAAEASGQRAVECVNVLRQLATQENETGPLAKAALEKLSQAQNQEVAALAATALRDPRPPEIGRPNLVGFRFNAAGPAFRNGQRQVAVEDKGRKIEIVELQTGPITVKVTETVDGQPKTTEYKGDDKVDLLRKSPEAYQLYYRHLAVPGAQVLLNGLLPVGGGGVHVHVRTSNGERTIEVKEAGRQVRIQDKQGKDIVVEVTETLDGKETKKKIEAATLEELKQKDAAAAETYEKYTAAGGAIRFKGNILPFNANPPPRPVVPNVRPRADRPAAAHRSIEAALEQLTQVRKELETLMGAANADPQQLEALVERLRGVEKDLFAAQAQLEN